MTLPAVPVSQPPVDKFQEFLATRARPQRYTGQQRDLVNHIFEKHHHFDAEGLVDDLKKAGLRISRATVYRTLSKLVEAGMLRRHDIDARAYYEHDYGYPQHDHLICEGCGRMIEFQDARVDEVLEQISRQHGFVIASRSFLARGTCLECNRSRSSKRKLDLI
jgi:Fur family transcriptional regulator, ferric uptake regulator